MGNTLCNRSSSPTRERKVRNRSNRISPKCAWQIDNNRQSASVDIKRYKANSCELERTQSNDSTESSKKTRKPNISSYLKLPSYIGESRKWINSRTTRETRDDAACRFQPRSDFSPCFNQRAYGCRFLTVLDYAADDCVSTCCDLASISAACTDSHKWKLSDSFSGLFCGSLNCATNNSPPKHTIMANSNRSLRENSAVSLLSLPRRSGVPATTDSLRSRSPPSKYSPIMSTASCSSDLRRSKSSSSICELFSVSGKQSLLSASADISDNLIDSSVNSSRHCVPIDNHDYAELDQLLVQHCAGAASRLPDDSNSTLLQQTESNFEAESVHETNEELPCIDKLPVHEFASWCRQSVMVIQQQSADNLPFSQFLFNNLQLFSKADLRKLKALNIEAQKQVRNALADAEKGRELLCKTCNEDYMKFVDQRELELSQLITQQKQEYQATESKNRSTLKLIEKELRQVARQRRQSDGKAEGYNRSRGHVHQPNAVNGDQTDDIDECSTSVWQYQESSALNRGAASRWLSCACYNECALDGAFEIERQIGVRLSEVRLENERKLQELERKFLREKRQLLVAQEDRRFCSLECAIRRLSQLEVMEMRSFCQRRCELVTNRAKIEIDSIRRVRQAKRDALCRRQKAELKRAKANTSTNASANANATMNANTKGSARRGDASRTVLSLSGARAGALYEFHVQQQNDQREFDENTEKLVCDFEATASEKLRNLLDLRDLQLNHLRSIVDRKIESLRAQHAERVRLLTKRLENEALQQEACFAARQSSLPVVLNVQKINWSTLTWRINGSVNRNDKDKDRDRMRLYATAQSLSSGFASRDGSLLARP